MTEDLQKIKPHVKRCGWKYAITGSQCKYYPHLVRNIHNFEYKQNGIMIIM